MKISHEVPLSLLEKSLEFNDYDYILPSYLKYPQYKEFNTRKNNRFRILDNGLFEDDLRPDDELLGLIKEIKPDIFIVPDAWNDMSKTLKNAEKWIQFIPELPSTTNLMIVIQGKTYSELSSCLWRAYDMNYRHFGFNHSSEAYGKIYPHKNKLISKMMGRIITMDRVSTEDIFEQLKSTYIHLLGVSLPQEILYHNQNLITSVDTSNPIILGIKGERYSDLGIDYKPFEKIEKFMEKDLASNLDDIIFNVNRFRLWSNNEA